MWYSPLSSDIDSRPDWSTRTSALASGTLWRLSVMMPRTVAKALLPAAGGVAVCAPALGPTANVAAARRASEARLGNLREAAISGRTAEVGAVARAGGAQAHIA